MLQAGAADSDIVREVDVSGQELQRIYNEHPELQQIRKAKHNADQQVEDGLLKRAMGAAGQQRTPRVLSASRILVFAKK